MKRFSVKMDELYYCITSPEGEDGDMVPYGQRAMLEDGKDIYTCLVEDSDDQSPEVFRVDELSLMHSEVDEVTWPPEVTEALDAVAKAQSALEKVIEKFAGKEPVVDVKAIPQA